MASPERIQLSAKSEEETLRGQLIEPGMNPSGDADKDNEQIKRIADQLADLDRSSAVGQPEKSTSPNVQLSFTPGGDFSKTSKSESHAKRERAVNNLTILNSFQQLGSSNNKILKRAIVQKRPPDKHRNVQKALYQIADEIESKKKLLPSIGTERMVAGRQIRTYQNRLQELQSQEHIDPARIEKLQNHISKLQDIHQFMEKPATETTESPETKELREQLEKRYTIGEHKDLGSTVLKDGDYIYHNDNAQVLWSKDPTQTQQRRFDFIQKDLQELMNLKNTEESTEENLENSSEADNSTIDTEVNNSANSRSEVIIPLEHQRFAPGNTDNTAPEKPLSSAEKVQAARDAYLASYREQFEGKGVKKSATRGVLKMAQSVGILRKDNTAFMSKETKALKEAYEGAQNDVLKEKADRLRAKGKTEKEVKEIMQRFNAIHSMLEKIENESKLVHDARREILGRNEKLRAVLEQSTGWYTKLSPTKKRAIGIGVASLIAVGSGGITTVGSAGTFIAARLVRMAAGNTAGFLMHKAGEQLWKTGEGGKYETALKELRDAYMQGEITPAQYQQDKEGLERLEKLAQTTKTALAMAAAGAVGYGTGELNLTPISGVDIDNHESMFSNQASVDQESPAINFKTTWQEGQDPSDVDLSARQEIKPAVATNATPETALAPAETIVPEETAKMTTVAPAAETVETNAPTTAEAPKPNPVSADRISEKVTDTSEADTIRIVPNGMTYEQVIAQEQAGSPSTAETAQTLEPLTEEDFSRLEQEEEFGIGNGSDADQPRTETSAIDDATAARLEQEELNGIAQQATQEPQVLEVPEAPSAESTLPDISDDELERLEMEERGDIAGQEQPPQQSAADQPETFMNPSAEATPETSPEAAAEALEKSIQIEKEELLKQYFGKHDFIRGDYIDTELWKPEIQKLDAKLFLDQPQSNIQPQYQQFHKDLAYLGGKYNIPITTGTSVEDVMNEIAKKLVAERSR